LKPFEDPALVSGYEEWYQTAGHRADRLERALLGRLVAAFPQAKTVLEVGCGTGHFTRWMASQSLAAVGLDISRAMLTEAAHLGSRALVRGDALALPFGRGAFDLVALITTLEFTLEPVSILAETLRVARYGLVLGVLNRQSQLGRQRKEEGGPVWDAARFFTPMELSVLVKRAAGGKRIGITWRTTLWTVWPGALPLPWGGFVGMAVELVE
jgi:ubiquinone/menaquinone biosynthesis C-methylase UbiE